MNIIEQYTPPAPADLARLKDALGLTSNNMAVLAGLSQGAHWRKYTGGSEPRALGKLMHFYLAALLELEPAELERVYATMRQHGAEFSTAPGPRVTDAG